MKKFILLLLACISLTSCCKWTYVSLKEIPSTDYKNYINQYYSQDHSPSTYSVIYGENPSNNFDWNTVTIKDYEPKMFNYFCYVGNKDDLIKAAYPSADVILFYSSCYAIGIKKQK